MVSRNLEHTDLMEMPRGGQPAKLTVAPTFPVCKYICLLSEVHSQDYEFIISFSCGS